MSLWQQITEKSKKVHVKKDLWRFLLFFKYM